MGSFSYDNRCDRCSNRGHTCSGAREVAATSTSESQFVEAVVGVCGGDYEAQEIVRLRRIFTSGGEHGKGHFDANSIFFTDDFPGARGVLDFDTCKWLYDLVSQEPPEVPECEFPGIQPTHD